MAGKLFGTIPLSHTVLLLQQVHNEILMNPMKFVNISIILTIHIYYYIIPKAPITAIIIQ